MTRIITPTREWNTITEDDIPSVVEILSDWEHGPKRLYRRDIENDCYKWLKYMDTHPIHHPVQPDSNYLDCLITYNGNAPVAFIRYTVWGGSHKLAGLIPLSSLTLNILAIHPNFRGQGLQNIILDELVSSCFKVTQPAVVYAWSSTPQGDSRINNSGRTYQRDEQIVSNATKKSRRKVVLTKENFDAFIAIDPSKDIPITLG